MSRLTNCEKQKLLLEYCKVNATKQKKGLSHVICNILSVSSLLMDCAHHMTHFVLAIRAAMRKERCEEV